MVNADPLTWVAKVCVVKSYLIRQMSVEHGQMSYTQGVAGAVVVLDWTMYELLLLELPPHDRLTEKREESTIYLPSFITEFLPRFRAISYR